QSARARLAWPRELSEGRTRPARALVRARPRGVRTLRRMRASNPGPAPSLVEITRAWGRIGTLGFGGPPTHIALLRELCVEATQMAWRELRSRTDRCASGCTRCVRPQIRAIRRTLADICALRHKR